MTTTDQEKESTKAQLIWKEALNIEDDVQKYQKHYKNNVIIIGHESNGKRTLVTQLGNKDNLDVKEIGALEYSCVTMNVSHNISNAGELDLNIWMLDDPKFQELLPVALNEKNIESSVVMVTVDLSEYWKVDERVLECLEMVKNRVGEIQRNMKADKVKDMKKRLEDYVQMEKSKQQIKYNLGIPLVITGCKSDIVSKYNPTKENQILDNIQYSLRSTANNYGAGLVYTSCREHRKIDLLRSYLLYRLTFTKHEKKPDIRSKNSLFIPGGLDSQREIEAIPKSSVTSVSDLIDDNDDVPFFASEKRVPVEPLQKFLKRMKSKKEKSNVSGKETFQREAKPSISLAGKTSIKKDNQSASEFFNKIKQEKWAQKLERNKQRKQT